jgi:tetratricopeptide (TPR) repeat protein
MRAKLFLLSLFLLLAAPAIAAAVDPFYMGLLRDGRQAFDRKEYATASRLLNLACFGMLDEPKVLADCLARLALCQDKADDVDGFRETFRRLVEVEERFSAYSQGELPPELRTALEPRLVARLPAATLESVPVFRPLVAKKDGKKPEAAPTVAKKADTTAATVKKPDATSVTAKKPEKTDPAPAIVKKPDSPAGPPAPPATTASMKAKPPATTPSPAPAAEVKPGAKPITEAERKKMEQARQLLSQERPAKELKQAFQLAREVADAHPGAKDAQHLAAEAAYRISRWSDAAAYFHRGGDPGEDEPERLFYLAVALHELGDDSAAAAALKRALPNLRRTPYVDSYAKSILGQ